MLLHHLSVAVLSILVYSSFATVNTAFVPTNIRSSPNSQLYREKLFGRDKYILKNSGSPQDSAGWMQGGSGDANPNNEDGTEEEDGGSGTLKAARFSKYAPDAALPTDDFRAQLKQNMKADLERRRKEDPNRGNQPTRSYLDNL